MTHWVEITLHGPAGIEHRASAASNEETNRALAKKVANDKFELAGQKFPLPKKAADKSADE